MLTQKYRTVFKSPYIWNFPNWNPWFHWLARSSPKLLHIFFEAKEFLWQANMGFTLVTNLFSMEICSFTILNRTIIPWNFSARWIFFKPNLKSYFVWTKWVLLCSAMMILSQKQKLCDLRWPSQKAEQYQQSHRKFWPSNQKKIVVYTWYGLPYFVIVDTVTVS